MSRLDCTFCAHRNPERSKFCNQCGSPLHLAPCAQCEAINNASDTHCYACGVPLTEERSEELATAGFRESAHGETGAWVYDRPPAYDHPPAVQLRDHLEDISWDLPTRAQASAPHEAPPESGQCEREGEEPSEREEPALAGAMGEPANFASPDDDTSARAYASGRAYKRRSSRWGKRIVLGCALLAIAGAIAWSALQLRLAWNTGAVMPSAPTVETPPTPAAPAASGAPPASVAPSASAPRATSAPPPNTPVTDNTAAPPEAVTQIAPVPSATPTPAVKPTTEPRSDERTAPPPAQVVPRATAVPPAAGGKVQATNDARRRSEAVARTREQALRDAAATQRLIEQQLSDVPRTGQNAAPPARP